VNCDLELELRPGEGGRCRGGSERGVCRSGTAAVLAFELGNEVENYGRGDRPFRKPPYPYETYRKEYGEWRGAILKAVAGARFAASDTASSMEWVERMAGDARGDVQLLALASSAHPSHCRKRSQPTFLRAAGFWAVRSCARRADSCS